MKEEVAKNETIISELRKSNAEAELVVTELRKNTAETESTVSELRKNSAGTESIINELRKNSAGAELVVSQLKKNAAETESTVSELRKNSAGTESIISELRKNAAGTESIVSELKKKTSEYDCEVSQISKEISQINKKIADTQLVIEGNKLEYLNREYEYKKKYMEKVNESSDKISNRIAQNLIDDPKWLDRFMERTGATYAGSVYGSRINHFYYEKKIIAENCLNILDKMMIKNSNKKYCFLIDSGTTLYHVFFEICEKMKNDQTKSRWCEQVCIVTNNLPGIQYLMRHCKDKDNDEYSEIAIPCFLLPGKPLSVYAAVTGDEACKWLEKPSINSEEPDVAIGENESIELSQLEMFLNSLWNVPRDGYEIISLMTANYIVRHPGSDSKDSYYPVARGEGHAKIKRRFAEVSDKIYILSPLTKFSFATVTQLNNENQLNIDEIKFPNQAKKNPSKVKYDLIPIKNDKHKCTFFTTQRVQGNIFYGFSDALITRLKEYYDNVEVVDFDIKYSIPEEDKNENYQHIQIEKEIPHKILRDNYNSRRRKKQPYIWDMAWISYHPDEELKDREKLDEK